MPPKKKTEELDLSNLSKEDIFKAIRSISKDGGYLGEEEIVKFCTVKKMPTGVPSVDYLLGGGFSEGKVIILAGKESSGKSTLTYHFIKSAIDEMKRTGEFKLILIEDVENSFDPAYAKSIGIDLDYIYRREDKVIEDGFAEIAKIVSLGIIKVLVIDSLDGMISRKVDENAYQNTMGGTAGALAMHLPNLHSKLSEHNVTTVIIKQARVKMGFNPSGQEMLTFSGGKALRHFADTILMLGKLSRKDLDYLPSKVKAEKTRSSRMGLSLEIPIGKSGIDCIRDLARLAELHNMFEKSGTWYSYEGNRAQGFEKLVSLIRDDEVLYNKLLKDVYDNIINIYGVIAEIPDIEDDKVEGELSVDEVLAIDGDE